MVRHLLILSGLAVLSSCGTKPVRLRYGDGLPGVRDILIADEAVIHKHCARYASHKDDGTPIGPNDKIEACYRPWNQTILISWRRLCKLPHELCHAAGIAPADCHKPPYLSQCPGDQKR